MCWVGCSKFLMRWTVLSSDILVFFPAAIAFVLLYYQRRAFEEQAFALGIILLQPALMLIDHGHFQVCLLSWPHCRVQDTQLIVSLLQKDPVIVPRFEVQLFINNRARVCSYQFNCISLGLAVGAAAAVIARQELMACVFFSLSLNHKQVPTPDLNSKQSACVLIKF